MNYRRLDTVELWEKGNELLLNDKIKIIAYAFYFLNVLFYDNFHSIYKLPKWNSFSDCQLSLSIVLYTILNFNANSTYNNVRAVRIH